MSNLEQNSSFNRLVKRIAVNYSPAITVVLFVVSAIGFYLSTSLKLKLSLTDLLPDNHPSVVKFDQITEIVGGVGYLIAIMEADDNKSHLDVAPQLITELNKSPLIRNAFFDREEYFFSTRMLYYAELDDLNQLESTIDKNIRNTKRRIFDLGLWDEDEVKAQDIDPDVKERAKRAADVLPELRTRDSEYMLLMIKPSFDSTDLGQTKELLAYTKEVFAKNLPKNVSYSLAGRYFNKVEDSQVITKDIAVLGTTSIAIICLILLLYLRSFRALCVIFFPVAMGLGITSGMAVLVIGHINIITGFLMGIVSGLGVDYGIHMVLRLRLEKREPSSNDPDPVWRTLASSGHAVFIGAVAASLAFYFLCFSDFRAFSEFGFIAGTGILAVLFCLLLSFSALARWLKLEQANYASSEKGWGTLPLLNSKPRLVGAAVITVVVAVAAFFVRFQYNFEEMMQHSQKVIEQNNLVDKIYERSVTPSVFAVPEKEVAKQVEKSLEENHVPKTIEVIVSGATIIPEQQAEKRVILKRIRKKIRKFKDKWLEKELDIPARTIRRWVNAKPFTFDDLPIHLQDMLRGKKGDDFLMYLYPAIPLNNATGVRQYASMVRDIESKFDSVLTGSDAVVFAEILDLIKRDGLIILLVIFFSVGFFIWVNVRRIDDTVTSYLPLLLALPLGMGLMAICGVKFNIFNIAIIPSFVAMGIDVPIHIVHRAREIRSGFKAATDLAASIHLALATAGVGFGVLIFSGAGVLRSLGWIAFLGTVAIWWTGLFILPALLEYHYRNRAKGQPHSGGPSKIPSPEQNASHSRGEAVPTAAARSSAPPNP